VVFSEHIKHKELQPHNTEYSISLKGVGELHFIYYCYVIPDPDAIYTLM